VLAQGRLEGHDADFRRREQGHAAHSMTGTAEPNAPA
jgi:hypothetical protein